ncbi:MAG: glycosyltransferase, partial [Desulfosalsimonadaceae bacterium]|nr:glycosyltransferase [Desulfosalsimonadaceae bacterium]
VGKIRNKSFVLYPGITLPRPEEVDARQTSPPLIIWNHRWGFDKNHRLFFSVLEELSKQRLGFQVALLGENFSKIPEEFIRAREILKDRIVAFGYVASRDDYIKWLKRGTVVVSTALQENFGMSVIEAIIMGCFPLLPNRLSYPEILPKEFHTHCLYKNRNDLLEKLARIIGDVQGIARVQTGLSEKMQSFLWENVVSDFDTALEHLVQA